MSKYVKVMFGTTSGANSNVYFEDNISVNQELTFKALEEQFASQNLKLDKV